MRQSDVTNDGSPVEVYAALPAEPELSTVRKLLGARQRVLDLGCGAGRIASALAASGCDVVAVDDSPAMLRHVRHARTHRHSIETLSLSERFDAVLLLSHLINGENREALVSVAARHLDADGILIAQRLPPEHAWHPGSSQFGEVTVELLEVSKTGDQLCGVTRYSLHNRRWDQQWTLTDLSDEDVRRLLKRGGLEALTLDGPWITAKRLPDQA